MTQATLTFANPFADLVRLPTSELEHVVRSGERPDFASLDGWTFRGANITYPGKLLFPKFSKGFFTENGRAMGYNLPCLGGSWDEEWQLAQDAKPFGFYECRKLSTGDCLAEYPNALLLDYGRGGNKPWQPERFLRDYVVKAGPDLLLGKAYVEVGVLVYAGFFALARWQKRAGMPR